MTFLGFEYNSKNMKMCLPQTKKVNISLELDNKKSNSYCSIRHFARLIGNLIAACPVIKYGAVHVQNLERAKYRALSLENNKYNKTMKIPSYVGKDIQWWLNNLQTSYQFMKTSNTFKFEIFTDASQTVWEAHTNRESTNGFWSMAKQKFHINYLELLAASYGLKSFGKHHSNCDILLRIENKTAIACINKKGSVQFPKLNKITRDIWG